MDNSKKIKYITTNKKISRSSLNFSKVVDVAISGGSLFLSLAVLTKKEYLNTFLVFIGTYNLNL